MSNYRNPRLLTRIKKASLAGGLPCFWPLPHGCTRYMPGSVVYAHSNQLRDGKARGMKAHDSRIALLCFGAHQDCDQGQSSKATKFAAWDLACLRTYWWMLEQGILVVA